MSKKKDLCSVLLDVIVSNAANLTGVLAGLICMFTAPVIPFKVHCN